MTLKDWIYGTGFDNPKVNGEWGPLHIATLICDFFNFCQLGFIV